MKIKEYKVRLIKWGVLKLIDLCKHDSNILYVWLDDLKWKMVKDQFRIFKKAAMNEKAEIDYTYLYYNDKINYCYKTEKMADNLFYIKRIDRKETKVICSFNTFAEAEEYANIKNKLAN